MKKNYLLLPILLVLTILGNLNAQSFEQGSLHFDLGIGFGAYGTKQSYTTTIANLSTTQDTTDGAASMVIPISFEYGLTDRIGIGVDLTINNYIISDSDKVNLSSVRSFDFGPKLNYHLFHADKNDLFIGVGLGVSTIKWSYKASLTNNVESATGSGIYYSLVVGDRIFLSDYVGLLFNVSYKGYRYSGITTNYTADFQQLINASNINYSQKFDWNLSGVNLGVGLAFKF